MMQVVKVGISLLKRNTRLLCVLCTDELKKPLDDAVAKLTKTRVLRLKKREGLIRTRIAGAREAKGEVIIFFDSHIEVNTNWLPPLIDPIAIDYKTSVCPFIDIIRWENFAYVAQDEGERIRSNLSLVMELSSLGARGAFDWGMYYKRLPLLSGQSQNPSDPFE